MKNKQIKDFFITTLNGMAHGLFATLIIGTIFGTIGTLFSYGAGNPFCDFMTSIIGTGKSGISFVLQMLTGAGIGVGIAFALKFNPLQTIVLAVAGEIAAFFSLSSSFVTSGTLPDLTQFKIGDPLTIYFVCIVTALAMKYVLAKKTPVDIILIPLFGTAVGLVASMLLRYPSIYVTYGVQWVVDNGTTVAPFLSGIIVAVLMGMALTAPISSAAIAFVVFSAGATAGSGLALASGAAVVGCSCQMVGFAIQSIHDNKPGTVISVAIGTSMLQFKNIIRKPVVWLPTIIASAILGPISTCVVKTVCLGSSAGMGTAGFVGQIGTISSMIASEAPIWQIVLSVSVLQIIAPALLVFGLDLLFRKLNWIKPGDLTV